MATNDLQSDAGQQLGVPSNENPVIFGDFGVLLQLGAPSLVDLFGKWLKRAGRRLAQCAGSE